MFPKVTTEISGNVILTPNLALARRELQAAGERAGGAARRGGV